MRARREDFRHTLRGDPSDPDYRKPKRPKAPDPGASASFSPGMRIAPEEGTREKEVGSLPSRARGFRSIVHGCPDPEPAHDPACESDGEGRHAELNTAGAARDRHIQPIVDEEPAAAPDGGGLASLRNLEQPRSPHRPRPQVQRHPWAPCPDQTSRMLLEDRTPQDRVVGDEVEARQLPGDPIR